MKNMLVWLRDFWEYGSNRGMYSDVCYCQSALREVYPLPLRGNTACPCGRIHQDGRLVCRIVRFKKAGRNE